MPCSRHKLILKRHPRWPVRKQRYILLSVVLFFLAVVVILHSRAFPNNSNDNNDQLPTEHHHFRYVSQSLGSVSSECPHLLRPENVTETQQFQKVDGSSSQLEFSAFLDRQEGLVRIVGLHHMNLNTQKYCLLWYRPLPRPRPLPHPLPEGSGGVGVRGVAEEEEEGGGVKEVVVVPGEMLELPESHAKRYAVHYIECPLPRHSTSAKSHSPHYPYAVSVTSNKDCCHFSSTYPSNVMPVIHSYENNSPPSSSSSSSSSSGGGLKRNFTVCVTPLNFRYSRAYELVEMIELNRLLGADLFTFYVNSIGDNVDQILQWYQARGIVELVDWKLPMVVDHWPPSKQRVEVHYFAQIASHNDCLNRHRGFSRYLVYQDLDEFIIPKKTSTWGQLLASFHDKAPGYLFRCVFFRKDWPQNSENFTGRAEAERYRSVVLLTDKREPDYPPHSRRAKLIVDPEAVHTVGIHNVWVYRRKWGAASRPQLTRVWESDAALHHYRSWEKPGDAWRAVRDTDVHRFKDRLLERLARRWGQLPQVSLDVPLSQYGQV